MSLSNNYKINDFEFLENGGDDFIFGNKDGKFYISDWSANDITIKS